MPKKSTQARKKNPAKSSAPLGLPKGWTLPALAERRQKPRPQNETPQQRQRGAAQRSKRSA